MKSGIFPLFFFCTILLLSPHVVYAAAHQECEICHGNRLGVGLAIISKDRQIAIINPNTGTPLSRIEGICLACHARKTEEDFVPSTDEDLERMDRAKAEKAEAAGKLEKTTAVLTEMMLKPIDVGLTAINLHETHPVGIKPVKVVLPPESKGFKTQEEELTCMGCHNHHPSNPNYKYLRWPTDPKKISEFCAHCHKSQSPVPAEDKKKPRKARQGMVSGE